MCVSSSVGPNVCIMIPLPLRARLYCLTLLNYISIIKTRRRRRHNAAAHARHASFSSLHHSTQTPHPRSRRNAPPQYPNRNRVQHVLVAPFESNQRTPVTQTMRTTTQPHASAAQSCCDDDDACVGVHVSSVMTMMRALGFMFQVL